MSMFSPDSKFMRAMSRIADLIILNFIYVLTCIPILTIGAANTALYTVAFKIGTKKENGIIKEYFNAFKDNFSQSTKIWLVYLLIGVTAFFNICLFYVMQGSLHYLFIVFMIIFALLICMGSYTFPLLSQFNNSSKQVMKNGLILSFAYLPRTIAMVILNILPFVLLSVNILTFFYSGFIWIAIYFSAIAYLNSHIIRKVFAPYMPKDILKEDE